MPAAIRLNEGTELRRSVIGPKIVANNPMATTDVDETDTKEAKLLAGK